MGSRPRAGVLLDLTNLPQLLTRSAGGFLFTRGGCTGGPDWDPLTGFWSLNCCRPQFVLFPLGGGVAFAGCTEVRSVQQVFTMSLVYGVWTTTDWSAGSCVRFRGLSYWFRSNFIPTKCWSLCYGGETTTPIWRQLFPSAGPTTSPTRGGGGGGL